MTEAITRQARICAACIQTLQKGTSAERYGKLRLNENGTNGDLAFALELQGGDRVDCRLFLRGKTAQFYLRLAEKLPFEDCAKAAIACNAANGRIAFGHFVVDSIAGSVAYLFTQLVPADPDEDFLNGLILMPFVALNAYYAPLLDFIESGMTRQDMDDYIERVRMLSGEEKAEPLGDLSDFQDEDE